MFLETKIPPPVVALIFIGLIIGSGCYVETISFPFQNLLAVGLLAIGLFFMVSGVRAFRKLETTVNPLTPEAATRLATQGVYGFTRNPMYLGLSFVLLAVSCYVGSVPGPLLVALFMAYIHFFQIRPEERAMEKLFGDKFEAYKNKVRRWL